MKRFVTLICIVLTTLAGWAQNNKIVNRTEGSITFTVDENLAPISENTLTIEEFMTDGSRALGKRFGIFEGEGVPGDTKKWVAKSFSDEEEFYIFKGKDVFFQTIVRAYADHRPLVLSPDMVWLLISQGFARYVNAHPEELRDQLVSHTGKMDLVIETEKELLAGDPEWDKLIDAFAKQINEYTKEDIAKTITADFTTTGTIERITSQITLMETMKSYFDYIVHYIACGIPTVTLTGTPEDWEKVLEKTKELEKYGMEDWIQSLTPILTEFVNASKGKPDQTFWQSMVKKYNPNQLVGGNCDFRNPTELDGWILKLFPDEKGQTLDQVPHTHTMPSERVYVDFKYQIIDPENGDVLTTIPMQLIAGYIGTEVDTLTHTLTPKMGWVVRQLEGEETIVEKLKKMDEEDSFFGIELRVNRVPEHLSKLSHIRQLWLHFTDEIVLPEWMDKMTIDNFKVDGKITEEEEKALRQRFPNIIINNVERQASPGNRNPLIVVNGEPYPVNEDIEDIYDEDIAELVGVDPDDIKDITILKDAAATAIWGEKGRNGVIEIKTKSDKTKTKGKKIKAKRTHTIIGTVSDAAGPLWGANVVEINEQGRIVKSTTTDSLGHFTLKTVNPEDKIRISYIGSKTVELNNNRNEYNIVMQDVTKIKDVPLRKRNVNTDDFEGILPSTNPTKPIQK